ncbi:MAG TPA: DUF3159 domain-containing protein [Actinomycetota bacterium]
MSDDDVVGPPAEAAEAADREQELQDEIAKLRKAIGGKQGMIDSAGPAVVFATANAVLDLNAAAVAAGAYGVGAAIYRAARKEDVKRAFVGLIGLGIALFLALRSGNAADYFWPGVIGGFLSGTLALLTVAVKQPMSSLLAQTVEDRPPAYFTQPSVVRAHGWVTTGWALWFVAKSGVRLWLIKAGQTELLGASAIALGAPATALFAFLTVLYLRRVGHRLDAAHEPGRA